jgi:hypothetical protein
MTHDPTRDEMLEYLCAQPFAGEADDFDREQAIYWFAAHYHGGQWSNLYAALCASEYSPGNLECEPHPDSIGADLYADLVAWFAPATAPAPSGETPPAKADFGMHPMVRYTFGRS